MAVVVIVVGEEDVAEGAGVVDGPELSGERGAVFEGLELRLAVGIVIRDVRPGVALCDVQVGEQRGDGFGGH